VSIRKRQTAIPILIYSPFSRRSSDAPDKFDFITKWRTKKVSDAEGADVMDEKVEPEPKIMSEEEAYGEIERFENKEIPVGPQMMSDARRASVTPSMDRKSIEKPAMVQASTDGSLAVNAPVIDVDAVPNESSVTLQLPATN
jgi:hypothetical protein